jgi:hypothetical protein
MSADLGISAHTLAVVRDGMSAVVNERGGTAYDEFASAGFLRRGIHVYGKTGSTQDPETAWFGGFAEDTRGRKIALAVVVEGGQHGSRDAAPLARHIIELSIAAGHIGSGPDSSPRQQTPRHNSRCSILSSRVAFREWRSSRNISAGSATNSVLHTSAEGKQAESLFEGHCMEKFRIVSILLQVALSTVFIGAQAGAVQESREDVSLEKLRLDSAKKLERFGQLLSMHAADNGGKFYTDSSALGKYLTPQDDALLGYMQVNIEYVGAGKTNEISPRTTVVAYDTSLPAQAGGTNVLSRMGTWSSSRRISCRTSHQVQARGKTTLADGTSQAAHEYSSPTTGGLTSRRAISGSLDSLSTLSNEFFAASAYVRSMVLTNQSEMIILRSSVQDYADEGKGGSTGCGQAYALAGTRRIDDMLPIASTVQPVTLSWRDTVRLAVQYDPLVKTRLSTGPVQFPAQPANSFMARTRRPSPVSGGASDPLAG